MYRNENDVLLLYFFMQRGLVPIHIHVKMVLNLLIKTWFLQSVLPIAHQGNIKYNYSIGTSFCHTQCRDLQMNRNYEKSLSLKRQWYWLMNLSLYFSTKAITWKVPPPPVCFHYSNKIETTGISKNHSLQKQRKNVTSTFRWYCKVLQNVSYLSW